MTVDKAQAPPPAGQGQPTPLELLTLHFTPAAQGTDSRPITEH
jgi:hypothetical protein